MAVIQKIIERAFLARDRDQREVYAELHLSPSTPGVTPGSAQPLALVLRIDHSSSESAFWKRQPSMEAAGIERAIRTAGDARSSVIRVGTAAATELLQPGDILEVTVAPYVSIVLR